MQTDLSKPYCKAVMIFLEKVLALAACQLLVCKLFGYIVNK